MIIVCTKYLLCIGLFSNKEIEQVHNVSEVFRNFFLKKVEKFSFVRLKRLFIYRSWRASFLWQLNEWITQNLSKTLTTSFFRLWKVVFLFHLVLLSHRIKFIIGSSYGGFFVVSMHTAFCTLCILQWCLPIFYFGLILKKIRCVSSFLKN